MAFLVAAAGALSQCRLLHTATPLLSMRPWQPEYRVPWNSSTEEDTAQHRHGLVTHGFMQKNSPRICCDRPGGNELFDMRRRELLSCAKPSVKQTLRLMSDCPRSLSA
jgi:hypothetical protein